MKISSRINQLLVQGQDTDRECSNCEDGEYISLEHELVCDTCYYVPAKSTPVSQPDAWEQFWQARDEYDGFYGPDRVKHVGGFMEPYP